MVELLLSVLATFCFGWASGDFLYDVKRPYQPMELSDRQRGVLGTPPCIKALMNCWEIARPDVFCKMTTDKWPDAGYYAKHLKMDNVCNDLRLHCTEPTGPQGFSPIKAKQYIDNYCANSLPGTTPWRIDYYDGYHYG